jgi:phosphatidylserine/phosphatidylglycerophosphate/cardiolipin synthase-like enzyme
MITRARLALTLWFAIVFLFASPATQAQQERLCDPSWENCYGQILELVRNETVSIDMAFYMIELPLLVDEVIARHNAGIRVRLIVEPRGSIKFPQNQPLLDKLQAAGIPMRYKLGDGIVHVKLALFGAQNTVLFTGSNFGDGDVQPYEPFANYVDGAWYFTNDSAVVNSFKTRVDDIWTDTTL